ncbi:MAG: glycosyltransferase [Nitrososphaeria archaeon]
MTKAIIFTINTSGYGSPQFLYLSSVLKNKLNIDSVIYEPYEKDRKFFNIDGFNRKLLISRFDRYLAIFKTIFLSYFQNLIVVVGHEEPLFAFLSSKTIVVYYYLEMHEDMNQQKSKSNFFKSSIKSKLLPLFAKKVSYIIAPQEDRLRIVIEKFPDKKGYTVLNCPLKKEVKNIIRQQDKINILYQGQINSYAQADKLLKLVEKTKNTVVWHIAGPVAEDFKEEVENLATHENVNYYGLLNATELSKVRNKCNVGIVTWGDNPSLTYKYAAPNKLFEYISDGMYVLSFANYSIGKWNKEFEFGYVSEDPDNDVDNLIFKLNELNENKNILEKQCLHNITLHLNTLNYEYQTSELIMQIKSDIEKQ